MFLGKISLRFDLFWEPRTIKAGTGNMSSDWIQKIVMDKEEQRAASLQDAEAIRRSERAAGRMLKALADQVERDVAEFKKASSLANLEYGFTPSQRFTVTHSNYPVLELEVILDRAELTCRYRAKKSASAQLETILEKTLFIMAGSRPDQEFFSIEGKECRVPAEISRILLEPLLSNLP
jgi:hypothetical protein